MVDSMIRANNIAESEIIAAMLLLIIAVVAAGVIYNQVLPVPLPPKEPNVHLVGYVTSDGTAIIEHMGGPALSNYEIYVDGELIYKSTGSPWEIGGKTPPSLLPSLTNPDDKVRVTVYTYTNTGTKTVVFEGILEGREQKEPVTPALYSMPISTLRTNSPDEDIICYYHFVHPTINPITYIYNWMLKPSGGQFKPFAQLIMPFDTFGRTQTRDYSGNDNHGSVADAIWTSTGRVGGAYQYSGNHYISFPYCFDDEYLGKITLEAWIKTSTSSGTILSFNREKYLELAISDGFVKWTTKAADGISDILGNIRVNDNLWHHVLVTYNSITGNGAIYVDGLLDIQQRMHLPGSALGTGETPIGYIGKGYAAENRKNLFSTDFENREERNYWSEDTSGIMTSVYDNVDTAASNVDGVADKGSESNFPNAQSISVDNNVMTIQESDQDAGTSILGKNSGSGSSYVTINGNQMYGQVFTATSTGEIYQATFYGRSNTGTRNAKIIICDSSGNILPNGISTSFSVSSTAGNKIGTWPAGSRPVVTNGQPYWIMVITDANALYLYYSSTSGGVSKIDTTNSYSSPTNPTDATTGTYNYRILYADINNLKYQIDFEYQWTSATYTIVNKEICIYVTSHTGSEHLQVNYWTGSMWSPLGTITTTGWSNFTATGLISSVYTIQFKGTSETTDASQDRWDIDVILLHLWADQGIFDIFPSAMINPHSGSNSLGGTGDFDPYSTAFNRNPINVTGYDDIIISFWYSYKQLQTSDSFGVYYRDGTTWIPLFQLSTPQPGEQQTPWIKVEAIVPDTIDSVVLQFRWTSSSPNAYIVIDDLEITGIPTGEEKNFIGLIDELRIYNRILSSEQIYQNYLNQKDGTTLKNVIVAEETSLGQTWKCIVTPNDSTQDDASTESDILYLISYGGG
ncbi:MAG: LamG-like jellyroll fold domain-containing protein [Candidatus Thermoplasmatota archaeon]